MTGNIRILVGLDRTETDVYLLEFLSIFSSYINIEKIYFFHIVPLLHVPDEIRDKYFSESKPEDESIKESLNDLKDKFFNETDQKKIEIEVRDGKSEKDLLRWTQVKKIDIMVLGRKARSSGSGRLIKKMVSLADTSIILVPEISKKRTETIYVAIDHSKVSMSALKIAISIAKISGASIVCHHVYQVPSGYHTSGKSYEEFSEIMKNNAKAESKKMLRDLDVANISMKFEYSLDEDDNPAKVIKDFTKKLMPDIIFIGSKGRTAAASLLLGSVAEKCLDYIEDMPIYVVKRKGENMDFIDALLKV